MRKRGSSSQQEVQYKEGMALSDINASLLYIHIAAPSLISGWLLSLIQFYGATLTCVLVAVGILALWYIAALRSPSN